MMEPTLAPYMGKVQDMPLEITDEDLAEKDNDALTKAKTTFSRKLHYYFALSREDAAKLMVRQNTAGSVFETFL